MPSSAQIAALEAAHNAYDVFIFTLEALASPPEEQCRLMGDFNTAWELRDDALCARYLIGSGLLTESQEAALDQFLVGIAALPIDDMPSGAGRTPNLAAMTHPSWQPIRGLARGLLAVLEPATRANQQFLGRSADAP